MKSTLATRDEEQLINAIVVIKRETSFFEVRVAYHANKYGRFSFERKNTSPFGYLAVPGTAKGKKQDSRSRLEVPKVSQESLRSLSGAPGVSQELRESLRSLSGASQELRESLRNLSGVSQEPLRS